RRPGGAVGHHLPARRLRGTGRTVGRTGDRPGGGSGMNEPKIVQCAVHFERETRGRKRIEAGADEPAVALPPGRVPRVARFLALALRLEGQLRQGVLKDCAEVARLGHVTRARVSQILSLVNLAPDIQEAATAGHGALADACEALGEAQAAVERLYGRWQELEAKRGS